MKKPTLLRGVTWLVSRMLLTIRADAFRTRTLSSRTQRHSFGLPAFLFAYRFCVSMCEPMVRQLAKNQSLSFLIGPPTEMLLSQFFRRAGASANPRARKESSMLDDCPHCPAKLPK